jgi:hypothetical protein
MPKLGGLKKNKNDLPVIGRVKPLLVPASSSPSHTKAGPSRKSLYLKNTGPGRFKLGFLPFPHPNQR